MPEPLVVRRGSKGFVAFYRAKGAIRGRKLMPAGPDAKPLVEILPMGNVTIPPTLHRKTGRPYIWGTKRSLFDARVDEHPEVTPADVDALVIAMRPWCPPRQVIPLLVPAPNAPPTDDRRMKAWAFKVIDNEIRTLTSMTSGRNWGLYKAACKLAKYAHHGVITSAELLSALEGACSMNGYATKAGPLQVQATIKSAFDKARGDSLPVLMDKPMPRQYANQSRW